MGTERGTPNAVSGCGSEVNVAKNLEIKVFLWYGIHYKTT
jgi:hypothetical protein